MATGRGVVTFDPVALIERGYEARSDPEAWLRALAPHVVPLLSAGWSGGTSYLFDARGPHELVAARREETDFDPNVVMGVVTAGFAALTREQLRDVVLAMRTPGISSLVDAVGTLPAVDAGVSPFAMRDSIAALVHAGDGRVAVFSNFSPHRVHLDAPTKRLWQRIALHLGAGCRLAGREATTNAEDVEAVIEPGGALVHATGKGESRASRDLLRAAAKDMDKARTRAGRADAMAALELWRGLLAGRWSLVDHFDSDGRRFILARRNDPDLPEPEALSRRQRQVVFYASVGWSNKEIGYALGLAENTVSAHLTRSLEKLGIANRAALVRISTDVAMATMRPPDA